LNCGWVSTNLVLPIIIYPHWEDEYRKKIEQALGLGKNLAQSDIMGDIR
jgi:hypothetical protein